MTSTVYTVQQKGGRYQEVELNETTTNSRAVIAPGRGGMAISFQSFGKELFYLDEATYQDEEANVRGGNPVLFPICGQLTDKCYEWEGRTYAMNNHGVARTRPWRIVSTGTDGGAAVTVSLTSDEDTLASYPFDFELLFTYVLKEGTLELKQEYRNRSERPMPMYPGFHPYFNTETKKLAYRNTGATRLFDYNDHQEKEFDGTADLNGKPESLALLDAASGEIRFQPAQDYAVRMSYDPLFKYVVLWSVEGKPFVCVEPWMAKTNELNEKKELVIVPPGGSLQASLRIKAELL